MSRFFMFLGVFAILLVVLVAHRPPAQCPTPTPRQPTGWCERKNGHLDKAPGSIVDCFRGWV